MGTTVESATNVSAASGAPSARGLLTSLTLHVLTLAVGLLVPAEAMRRSPRPRKEIAVVFYRPPQVERPAVAILPPLPREARGTRPRPGMEPPAPRAPEPSQSAPEDRSRPDLPPGPGEGVTVAEAPPQQKAGAPGILAFKDKFASLAQDNVAPRLGSKARFSDADDSRQASSRSMLTSTAPGSSGGIDVASLSRSVGGGGGSGKGGLPGGGGGGGAGIQGGSPGRATSPIASIGGGGRPLAQGGPGLARTDEEIQIVFDRHKASFYRLYNRELRNDPTLRGQMVLRLTIEPDGSVSMCMLQSTDMDASDLSAQVVNRVRTINFGAKDVKTVTIVYPIDFLPAA